MKASGTRTRMHKDRRKSGQGQSIAAQATFQRPDTNTQNASYAFIFPNEMEATDFYKKVANRSKYAVKAKEKEDRREARAEQKAQERAEREREKAAAAGAAPAAASVATSSPAKKKKGVKGKIDKSMISGPVSGAWCRRGLGRISRRRRESCGRTARERTRACQTRSVLAPPSSQCGWPTISALSC